MEELRKRLHILEHMTYDLDRICGLVYILKDAIWKNEEDLGVGYTMAAFCISEQLSEFEEKLDGLLEELFDAVRDISKQIA